MEAMVDAVSVTVNGKPVRLAAGTTVQDFLASKGYHDRLVVVELNEAILSRSAFASTVLSDDDRLEIVHFVGGG
jgi:thiamine biosynthesis protein ThiS